MKFSHSQKILLPAILLMALLSSCGGSKTVSSPADDITPTIDISDTTPARIVQVTGFKQGDCNGDTVSIQVGGVDAPVNLHEDGSLSFFTPLFFDETTQWSNPPTQTLDVEYFCGDTRVGVNANALTIEPLPKQPGTTQDILQNLGTALDEFAASLPAGTDGNGDSVTPDAQTLLLQATVQAARQLIRQQIDALGDDQSIATLLLDSMYYDSGYPDTINKLNEMMAQFRILTESLPDISDPGEGAITRFTAYRRANLGLPAIIISDQALALKMQKYVVLKEFVDTFIHQTVSDYQLFGTILGYIPGLQAHSVAVLELQGTLAFIEFIMSKLVLSAMPANIQSIQLNISKTDLEFSETARSQAVIRAVNAPSGMTINDWIGLVVGAVTDRYGDMPQFRTNLLNLTNSFVTVFNDAMANLTADPDVSFVYDLELTSVMPILTWQAEVTTPRFYKMGPLSPGQLEIIHPQTSRLEWQADDSHDGEADAYLMTSMDASARLIGHYFGGEYLGGAFGLNSVQSNVVKLNVNFQFSMEVDATTCIETSDTGELNILVGKILANGTLQGLEGMAINIIASNGSVHDNYGNSDANGEFHATIIPDSGASDMNLTISANDPAQSTRQLQRNLLIYIRDDCSGGSKPVRIEKYLTGQSQPSSVTILTYDGAGYLTANTTTSYFSSGYSFTDVTTYTNDSNGHVKTSHHEQLGKDFYTDSQYQTDQYGNATRIDSRSLSKSKVDSSGNPRLLSINQTDNQYSYFADGKIHFIHSNVHSEHYTYNDFNELESTSSNDSSASTEFIYQDGNLTEKIVTTPNFPTDFYYYENDSNGFRIKETWYSGNDLIEETIFVNDAFGNILSSKSNLWETYFFY
jgi:hypothetical protein